MSRVLQTVAMIFPTFHVEPQARIRWICKTYPELSSLASDTTNLLISTITAQSSSFQPVCAKAQQLRTVVEEYEVSLLHGYVTEVEDSWIPIFDDIIWEVDGIKDFGLNVSIAGFRNI